jgi:hypothetical protein
LRPTRKISFWWDHRVKIVSFLGTPVYSNPIPFERMKAYYHDNIDTDQRLPHEGEPTTTADLETLGVFACNIQDQAEVDRIAQEKGYKNRDEVFPLPLQVSFYFSEIEF